MTPNLELLKVEFREFCVTHLTLRWIDESFSLAGFSKGQLDSSPTGARRSQVMEYYASQDWTSLETLRKFAKTIENVLLFSFLDNEAKESLRELCTQAGFEVDRNGHTIHLTAKGVGQRVKNLIFAADGPKPEIIFADSVSNDIQIVKHAQHCLVYDRPIHTHGLLWHELVQWWKTTTNQDDVPDVAVARHLYARLEKSLASPPEKIIWKAYFKRFYSQLNEKLPALIPQVYLHYDPYTLSQLGSEKRLFRQRMDFLLLLSERTRVVIEVDGKQHYADGDIANPQRYAEMVAEDRKLQLAGYEVYRFGAFELQLANVEDLIHRFFQGLFQRHEIRSDPA